MYELNSHEAYMLLDKLRREYVNFYLVAERYWDFIEAGLNLDYLDSLLEDYEISLCTGEFGKEAFRHTRFDEQPNYDEMIVVF